MPTMQLVLPKRSNPGRFQQDSSVRLKNMYAEDAGADAKVQFPLYAIDGYATYVSFTGGGKVRAAVDLEDDGLYVVSNRSVQKVTTTPAASNLGSIGAALSTGMVTMIRDRAATPNIGVCLDGKYYTITSDVITEVDISAYAANGALTSIAILDGYGILFFENGKFYLTDADDLTTIDGLATAKAESSPDTGVRVYVSGRFAYFLSTRSIEVWGNTGATPVPFSRTATIDIGCLAGDSVAAIEQTFAFIAHDGTVRLMNGYTPTRISTHAVERSIADEEAPEDIKATSWENRGNVFYKISGANFSWVYNATTGLWHEEESQGLSRSRVNLAYRWNNKLLFGDYLEGVLYESSPDYYDENGTDIICEAVLPAVQDMPNRMTHHRLTVDCVTGVGRNAGDADAQDPQIMIDYSDDGGATFRGQRMHSLGAEGQRMTQVKEFRWGQAPARGRTYRLSVSSAVVRCIMGVSLDYEQQDH